MNSTAITITTEKGNTYTFNRIDNDVNGNGRYVVHYLDLGLDKYLTTKETVKAGLKKYRAKWYGGGFVVQSASLPHDAKILEDLGLHR